MIRDINPIDNNRGVERWEYMIVKFWSGSDDGKVPQEFGWFVGGRASYRLQVLNELGAGGWELVTSDFGSVIRHDSYATFKRRLP
jgi:hypothetical protein